MIELKEESDRSKFLGWVEEYFDGQLREVCEKIIKSDLDSGAESIPSVDVLTRAQHEHFKEEFALSAAAMTMPYTSE